MFTSKQIQSLNELELEVFRYVSDHPDTVAFMRIRELADCAHVSTTTVLHFCKKVGCERYSDFRNVMKNMQQLHLNSINRESEMKAFFSRMKSEKMRLLLEEASSLIASHDSILFIGIGNSGYICDYAARFFSNLGKFSLSVTDPWIPIVPSRNVRYLGIILSVSGHTSEITVFQDALHSFGSKTIAITSDADSPIAQSSDLVISYPVNLQKDKSGLDFTSQAPALLIVEELGRKLELRLNE